MTTPRPQGYRVIKLSQDQIAIVDAKNFDRLNAHKWYAWWCKNVNGFYAVRHEATDDGGQRTIYMHREILGLGFGDKRRADHQNQSLTLVNVESNLRIATFSQNQMNQRVRRDSGSRVRDVKILLTNKRGTTFQVKVTGYVASGRMSLRGSAKSLEKAEELRDWFSKRLHGEFASGG
jgi:hypothetical protein